MEGYTLIGRPGKAQQTNGLGRLVHVPSSRSLLKVSLFYMHPHGSVRGNYFSRSKIALTVVSESSLSIPSPSGASACRRKTRYWPWTGPKTTQCAPGTTSRRPPSSFLVFHAESRVARQEPRRLGERSRCRGDTARTYGFRGVFVGVVLPFEFCLRRVHGRTRWVWPDPRGPKCLTVREVDYIDTDLKTVDLNVVAHYQLNAKRPSPTVLSHFAFGGGINSMR